MPDPAPRPIPTTSRSGPKTRRNRRVCTSAASAARGRPAGPPLPLATGSGTGPSAGTDSAASPTSATQPAAFAEPAGSAPPRPSGRQGRCASCGYDLAGIRDAGRDRCPECGHTLDDTDSRRTREHTFFRRFGLGIALGAVVVLGGIAAMVALMGDRAVLFGVPLILLLFGWLPFVLVARLTRDIE